MKVQSKTQVGSLLFDQTFIEVLAKYSNYNNVFSIENAAEFLKNTKINKYVIKLEKNKQLLFGLIYSLELVKLEI